jgi:transcriptional regulator with XRE-family HTH domain
MHALNALASERGRDGLTQEAVAAKTGVSRKQLSEWENGHTIPRADRLFDLANALGYDLALIPREDT